MNNLLTLLLTLFSRNFGAQTMRAEFLSFEIKHFNSNGQFDMQGKWPIASLKINENINEKVNNY